MAQWLTAFSSNQKEPGSIPPRHKGIEQSVLNQVKLNHSPPCRYDMPCKAHCYESTAQTRPSGRYVRTVRYPGDSAGGCQDCPNPPYHSICSYTCNKVI
ncbi:hypothetical protein EVAR_18683_1 [Eumeta japonica]|uniref:Uncharacterized protein n=1 Tax=Eumeta variegata TaxID=151549 RepID=A0A4C1U6P3_EUMVA|nr:hypothetical protein EVAR_18683_1 [Eumeta japonica]